MPVRIAAGRGLIRDQLGEWLHDEDFARAFGNRGRPGCGIPADGICCWPTAARPGSSPGGSTTPSSGSSRSHSRIPDIRSRP